MIGTRNHVEGKSPIDLMVLEASWGHDNLVDFLMQPPEPNKAAEPGLGELEGARVSGGVAG